MKSTTSTLAICSALLLASSAIGAAESPETGLMFTPEQMKWGTNPRAPSLGVARIISSGMKPGPYVYRVKYPKGTTVQPHTHTDDRTFTVISGTLYLGWGEIYDESKMTALPAGSFHTEPAGVPHFVASPDGETVVQITGTGPTKVDYVDPAKAPKK